MRSFFLIPQMKYDSDYKIKLSNPKGSMGDAAVGMLVTLVGIVIE